MPLHAGREFLSIPGPTVIPDVVLAAMQRPAVDIYSGPLVELTDSLLADISKVFATEGRSYIYIANGHGAWEAALTNVLSRGDKVLVLESGRFALGWGEAARMLGAEVEILPGDFRRAVKPGSRRGAAEGRRQGRDQGDTGGANRHRVGRDQRHQGDRARRCARRATTRCSWSMRSPRSAACRSRWTPGASTSRCRARRRA